MSIFSDPFLRDAETFFEWGLIPQRTMPIRPNDFNRDKDFFSPR